MTSIVSPASYWEIAIKVGKKKLDLLSTYDDFMNQGIEGNDFTILPIQPKHTSLLTTMRMHHKDPFDWLIISQAFAEQIAMVSIDLECRRIWRDPTLVITISGDINWPETDFDNASLTGE